MDFANWMGSRGIPFVIVFTKTDKRKNQKVNRKLFKEAFLEQWEEMPQVFVTSAKKTLGKDDMLRFINEIFHPQQ